MKDLNPVQYALWQAWIAADKALSEMIPNQPKLKADPSDEERQAYRDAMFDFREKWNTAIGYRDAMHDACGLAGIKQFQKGD